MIMVFVVHVVVVVVAIFVVDAVMVVVASVVAVVDAVIMVFECFQSCRDPRSLAQCACINCCTSSSKKARHPRLARQRSRESGTVRGLDPSPSW